MSRVPVTTAARQEATISRRTDVGLTVYGCEPDEADVFAALAPRFGVVPTCTRAPVAQGDAVSVPATRCISVGHTARVTAPTLLALRDAGVRFVSTRSIGVDHIDLAAAEALGITVGNVVYAPDGVADHTVMLMLMAVRDVMSVAGAVPRGGLGLDGPRGRELCDMTVGVVGAGRIGTAVVERLQGFGCRVLAAHESGRPTPDAAEHASLEALLRTSDIVTLHLPLTAETHHLIGRPQIAAMKRGALLVNTARGALVETDALISALERGELGGAALDVLEGEERLLDADRAERPVDDPFLPRLRRLPHVILTPHTAYRTQRALRAIVEGTLASCVAFETGSTGE